MSKLGPNVPQNSSFSCIAKLRGHLRQVEQVKIVNKIDKDRTAEKMTHTHNPVQFEGVAVRTFVVV